MNSVTSFVTDTTKLYSIIHGNGRYLICLKFDVIVVMYCRINKIKKKIVPKKQANNGHVMLEKKNKKCKIRLIIMINVKMKITLH